MRNKYHFTPKCVSISPTWKKQSNPFPLLVEKCLPSYFVSGVPRSMSWSHQKTGNSMESSDSVEEFIFWHLLLQSHFQSQRRLIRAGLKSVYGPVSLTSTCITASLCTKGINCSITAVPGVNIYRTTAVIWHRNKCPFYPFPLKAKRQIMVDVIGVFLSSVNAVCLLYTMQDCMTAQSAKITSQLRKALQSQTRFPIDSCHKRSICKAVDRTLPSANKLLTILFILWISLSMKVLFLHICVCDVNPAQSP